MPKLKIPRIVLIAIACLTAASCCAGIFSFHKNSTIGKRMLVCEKHSQGVTVEIYRWRLLRILGEKGLPLGEPSWSDNVIASISSGQRKTDFFLYGMTGDPRINFDNFNKAPKIEEDKLPKELLDYYKNEIEPSNATCARLVSEFGVIFLPYKGLSWDRGLSFPISHQSFERSAGAKKVGFIRGDELVQILMLAEKNRKPAEIPLPLQSENHFNMNKSSVKIIDGDTVTVTWPLVIPSAIEDIKPNALSEGKNIIWPREPSLLAIYQVTRGQQFWKLISLEQIGPLDVPPGMELILPKTVSLKKSYQPPAPKP